MKKKNHNPNRTKDAKVRDRVRRIKSLLRQGLSEERINELMNNQDSRTLLCLVNSSFSVEDGTKEVKIFHHGEDHKVTNVETKEVPNVLYGVKAALKVLKDNQIECWHAGKIHVWIKTDKDHCDHVTEVLKEMGRVQCYKPAKASAESKEAEVEVMRKAKNKTNKKPSNNNKEIAAKAKAARKETNMKKASMRPFYAAKRKGGVCARIKKHNPTLAKKIEAWLKEEKKREVEKAEKSKEYRAKHRQLTSTEMKANKRARKAARRIEAVKRLQERQKKLAENNAKQAKKRAQSKNKAVQTKLKMAA